MSRVKPPSEQATTAGIAGGRTQLSTPLSRQEMEKEQEWRVGFEAMGRDPDTNNVEYALPAAREILLGG